MSDYFLERAARERRNEFLAEAERVERARLVRAGSSDDRRLAHVLKRIRYSGRRGLAILRRSLFRAASAPR